MLCSAKLSLPWSCLFHNKCWRYVSAKGSFSMSTGNCLTSVGILSLCFSLQRVAARDSWVWTVFKSMLWIMLFLGVFSLAVSPAPGGRGAWVRAPPWFLAVAVRPWSRHSFSFHAPECLTGFTCKKGFARIRESCKDFHFSSTDDGLTGPGYIDPLACEQKKWTQPSFVFKSL